MQADHQVGEPRSRRNQPERLSPVRLDLNRLADLTDPDLIRIDLDAASQGHRSTTVPPSTIGAPLVDESAPAHVADSVLGDQSEEDRAGAESRPEPPALTASLTLGGSALADRDDRTELLSSVVAEPTNAEGPSGGHKSVSERRVYRLHRRAQLPALIGGAGIAAIALGLGMFALLDHRSATSQSGVSVPARHDSAHHRSSRTSTQHAQSLSSSAAQAVALVSSSSTGAVYDVAGGAHTVLLQVASQPCWVADASSSSGPIVWDATLSPGSSYTITWQGGPLWLRMGNSGVLSVSVNGTPVHFTAPPGPYNLTFLPAAS